MQSSLWTAGAILLVGYLLAHLLQQILGEVKNVRLALERISEDERLRVGVESASEELERIGKSLRNLESRD